MQKADRLLAVGNHVQPYGYIGIAKGFLRESYITGIVFYQQNLGCVPPPKVFMTSSWTVLSVRSKKSNPAEVACCSYSLQDLPAREMQLDQSFDLPGEFAYLFPPWQTLCHRQACRGYDRLEPRSIVEVL
jgi:hypothetical protein